MLVTGPRIVGVLLVLVGLVFTGQGLGLIRGSSAMVDDTRWAVIGAVLAMAGIAVLVTSYRRSSGDVSRR